MPFMGQQEKNRHTQKRFTQIPPFFRSGAKYTLLIYIHGIGNGMVTKNANNGSKPRKNSRSRVMSSNGAVRIILFILSGCFLKAYPERLPFKQRRFTPALTGSQIAVQTGVSS